MKLYLSDIFVGLLLLGWVGERLKNYFKNKKRSSLPPQSSWLLGFLFLAILSLVLSLPHRESGEVAIASLYLLRFVTYASLYFVFFNLKTKKLEFFKISISKFINFCLLFSGFFLAVFGIVQYMVFPDIKPLTQYHWDPHYFRVVSTFLDPTFTGLILALTLILLLSQFLTKKWKPNKALLIIGVIVYLSLALTYSRASYLACLTGITTLSVLKKRPKLFLAFLLVGILTIFSLPRPGGEGVRLERKSTIFAKIENYKNTIQIIKDHPLLGVGFNNYRFVQRDYGFLDKDDWQFTHAGAGSDSSLLFTLATTGVFGLILFLGWILKTLSYSLKQKNILVAVTIFALLTHSLPFCQFLVLPLDNVLALCDLRS